MFDLLTSFDFVIHSHINMRKTLKSLLILPNICSLVLSLIIGNTFKFEINKRKFKHISMLRDVSQGSSLSITLFNLCQDFVLKNTSNLDISSTYDLQIKSDVDNIITLTFFND